MSYEMPETVRKESKKLSLKERFANAAKAEDREAAIRRETVNWIENYNLNARDIAYHLDEFEKRIKGGGSEEPGFSGKMGFGLNDEDLKIVIDEAKNYPPIKEYLSKCDQMSEEEKEIKGKYPKF